MKNILHEVKNFYTLKEIICVLCGTFIFGVGVHTFTLPNSIAPGGIPGIATVVNYIFSAPVGIVTLIVNIPLILMAFLFLGKRFTCKTLINVVVLSFMIDIGTSFVPVYTGEKILAAIFGGACLGTGTGLVFLGGYTSGGTDVAAKLLQLKFPSISIGKLYMLVDCCVMLLAVITYKTIEIGLYAFITIFICSKMIDVVTSGGSSAKQVMIISSRNREFSEIIIKTLGCGVTFLHSEGGYTHSEGEVLLCAVKKQKFFELKKIILEYDPGAFLIVSDAVEVIGSKFSKQ